MQRKGFLIISSYIILTLVISHGTSYFILSPSNLTTCQDSPAMFQCQISDNVPIAWLINGMDPIFLSLNSPSTDVQTHLSTLLIPSSRNFSGGRIKCSYKLMPSGNAEYSSEAFLTAIGPFTTPSLTSLSVNLTTSNISWNLPSEDQTPLATFIYSILLIRNRNGMVVYNMTTQTQTLTFSIPDPCNTYDVTVSAVYQNPSTTCIINSSVPLTGAAPSAMLKMLHIYLLPPMDIYQMDNLSLNISFAFQPEVCNYFIVASTGNQVFSFSHLKPLVSNGVSTINIQLATNNIFNLKIVATNSYGNSTTYATISSFDVVNVTIEVSPTTGLCEVMCAYNSGSNAQGCLVFLKHEATGELYCISLYFNNTFMAVMKETLECRSSLLQSGMYYVNASDIEKNGSISETLAITNMMRTCNPQHPASDETNIAGAAAAVTILILVVVSISMCLYVRHKKSRKFRNLKPDEDKNKTHPVELHQLTSFEDNEGLSSIQSGSVENECTQLMEASKSGNIQQLTALLEKGAKVNHQDKDGCTALHYATKMRNACLEVLLDFNGIDVNIEDNNGRTVLHEAAINCSISSLKTCASKLHVWNKQDKIGNTALHFAAESGHNESVTFLLTNGCSLDVINQNEDTPLHLAAQNGRTHCLKAMLENDTAHVADVNAKNKVKNTALHCAALHCNKSSIKYLIQKGSLITPNEEGDTALHLVSKLGSSKCIRLLQPTLEILNFRNKNDRTAFHEAAINCHVSCLTTLASKMNDWNMKDKKGNTALHYAAENGSSECITFLANGCSDINLTNQVGQTALHMAAINGHDAVMKYLITTGKADANIRDKDGHTAFELAQKHRSELKEGFAVTRITQFSLQEDCQHKDKCTSLHKAADKGCLVCIKALLHTFTTIINREDEDKRTALHIAAERGYDTCVNYLCKSGSDITLRDKSGLTALHYAAQSGISACVQSLLKHFKQEDIDKCNSMERANMPCHEAADHCRSVCLQLLIPKDVNVKGKNDNTILHYAAKRGWLEGMKNIIDEQKADLNCENNKLHTPLHHAAKYGYYDCTHLLIERRCHVGVKSKNGSTALYRAAVNGHTKIVKLLLQTDRALVNVENNYGDTPLNAAAGNGHIEAVQELINVDGCDVNIPNTNTFHHAAGGHIKVVTALTCTSCKRVSLNSKNKDGHTALHRAALNGHTKVVDLLLETDHALLNVEDNNRNTALHLAAAEGYIEVVTALTSYKGVSLNSINKEKKTAYDIASAKGYDDIMKILHDASYAHPAATEMSDEYRVVMVEQTKQPANSGLADVDVSTNV